jgi:hypothetical protein
LLNFKPALASLSNAGVGIGPPNVDEAPQPTSSVMMSSTFGAPLGAWMPLGKSGVDSFAVRLIFPWKGGSGLGRTSWAAALSAGVIPATRLNARFAICAFRVPPFFGDGMSAGPPSRICFGQALCRAAFLPDTGQRTLPPRFAQMLELMNREPVD